MTVVKRRFCVSREQDKEISFYAEKFGKNRSEILRACLDYSFECQKEHEKEIKKKSMVATRRFVVDTLVKAKNIRAYVNELW